MTEEAAKFVIEQKMLTFNGVSSLCMTWWASSIVFCASILSGVWLKQDRIKQLPYFRLLGVVLGAFFVSLISFGICVFAYGYKLSADLAVLLQTIHASSESLDNEVRLLKLGIIDATSSFILITGAWIVLWRSLAKHR